MYLYFVLKVQLLGKSKRFQMIQKCLIQREMAKKSASVGDRRRLRRRLLYVHHKPNAMPNLIAIILVLAKLLNWLQ